MYEAVRERGEIGLKKAKLRLLDVPNLLLSSALDLISRALMPLIAHKATQAHHQSNEYLTSYQYMDRKCLLVAKKIPVAEGLRYLAGVEP